MTNSLKDLRSKPGLSDETFLGRAFVLGTDSRRRQLQPSKLSPALFGVALILSVSVLINYVDRGTLAIAAPLLKEDLHLSPSQLGVLLSAFFWTYAFCQILSGWLVDRFDVNRVLAIGVLIWSLATLGTGLTRGFAHAPGVRLLLGIGESVAYPSYSKIIAKHFNAEHRGRANGLISAGWAGGPAIGTLVGGLLVAHIGWRLVFRSARPREPLVASRMAPLDAARSRASSPNPSHASRRHVPKSCASAPPGARSSASSASTISGIS